MSSADGSKRHIACGCCRRRKLKCDGKRPSCSTCRRLNQVCEYPEVVRKAGPKRGYVRSLECRVAQLEKLLSEHCIDSSDSRTDAQDVVSLNLDEPMPPREVVLQLTEIFFQTFNVMLPVIDRTRYMTMLNCTPDKQPRPFLQYAIMATAAAVVPRFRRLKSILYSRARKYLHRAENFRRMNGAASVGFVQAICLIAHLECREGLLPQAWISVGKAHRALSMLLLAYIDGSTYQDQVVLDSAETAELRRAFWFAFLCDRLGSLATAISGTIDMSDLVTRVPMDDEAFLSGNYNTDTCRIEDLLRQPALFSRYPNARLAYLIALSECSYRALELGRFPRKQFMNAPNEWMEEYQKCDSTLAALRTQMPVIPPVPTPPPEGADPVAHARYQEEKSRRISYILINILAQAGMLGICRTGLYGIQAMPVLLPHMHPAKLLQQAMMAMLEILLITRNPHDLSAIGAHPLHPICLFVVSVLLLALADYELVALQNFQAPLAYMIDTLRELKDDMPLCVMLSAFLVNAVTPQKEESVKRVEEVLVARRVNLALPNFFEKWTDNDELSDSANNDMDLSQNELSPTGTDDNPPSVASSGFSPSDNFATPSHRPPTQPQRLPLSQPSKQHPATPSVQQGPPRAARSDSLSDVPGSISPVDVTSGLYIKPESEPVLSMDFESALEMSRAYDARKGVHEETRTTAALALDSDDSLEKQLKYRNPSSAPKTQSRLPPMDLETKEPPAPVEAVPVPMQHPNEEPQPPQDMAFDQVYHQHTFLGLDPSMFDDPPDIFPENVDFSMEDTLFTNPMAKETDDGHRWYDQSPNSLQQLAWP